MSNFNPLKLRSKRVEKDFSQEELSKKANLSQAALSAIETGKSSPNTDTLSRLCNVLGCKIENFFD